MAAGSVNLYTPAIGSAWQGGFNLSTDNYSVILLTNSYIPNTVTDTTYSNVSSFEVSSGGGYATGGISLTGVTWTQSSNNWTFAAQSAAWAGSTITARYAVIVRRSGVTLQPSDKLLCFADLTGGGSISTSASTFQINWNNASTPTAASTVFNISHTP